MAVIKVSEAVFACHDAACRPPTSGGTGGSSPSGGKKSVRGRGNLVPGHDYKNLESFPQRGGPNLADMIAGKSSNKKRIGDRLPASDTPLTNSGKNRLEGPTIVQTRPKTTGTSINYRVGGGFGPGAKGLSINRNGEMHVNFHGGLKNTAQTRIGKVEKVGNKYQIEVDGKTIKATTQSGLRAAVDRAFKSKK